MENLSLGVWDGFTDKIKNYLQTKDISTFIYWDILIYTMISGVDDIEVNYLSNSKNWDFWVKNLKEDVLKPNSHHIYNFSSSNNLHHAYSLQVMMDKLNCSITDYNFVTEFGGGYGNMARLFKKCNNNVRYNIYDIPELTQIQKYYLKQNNINDIIYLNNDDVIDKVLDKSLFIGLWSITETPIENRDYYIEKLKMMDHNTIFIAMGDMFYNENNMEWLTKIIIPKLSEKGFNCDIIKIEHGNGMFYFLANKVY